MRNRIELAGSSHSRRQLLTLLGGIAVLAAAPHAARAQREPSEAAVLRDPDNPVFGNPDGDITIVEWFDFNCPYCRKVEPELRQVVQDDGKIRLVLKDWPILGPVSVVASRMALACKYQGKYDKAHDAMIGVSSKLTEPRIDELLAGAGIDLPRARKDLEVHAKEIDGMLARNNATAEGLAFKGTPSFIVGKFRVPGVLTIDQFEQVVADARKAKAGNKT
jgi:protein-disulfide isomerase